ncbi:transmembrane protein, putative [Medicago truncatula]|uniref:Transmembrane protein, putative n=1 Tax=Medicago truncatula TaxID=3880 RepID=G7LF76_MEDTR|nr:transmembrane protein, putative [Medicago truncatula]
MSYGCENRTYVMLLILDKMIWPQPHSRCGHKDLKNFVFATLLIFILARFVAGFVNPLKFCCGSYYGYHINCFIFIIADTKGPKTGNPHKTARAAAAQALTAPVSRTENAAAAATPKNEPNKSQTPLKLLQNYRNKHIWKNSPILNNMMLQLLDQITLLSPDQSGVTNMTETSLSLHLGSQNLFSTFAKCATDNIMGQIEKLSIRQNPKCQLLDNLFRFEIHAHSLFSLPSSSLPPPLGVPLSSAASASHFPPSTGGSSPSAPHHLAQFTFSPIIAIFTASVALNHQYAATSQSSSNMSTKFYFSKDPIIGDCIMKGITLCVVYSSTPENLATECLPSILS